MGQQVLKLAGKTKPLQIVTQQKALLTVTTNACLPAAIRHKYALVTSLPPSVSKGYGALLLRNPVSDALDGNAYEIAADFDYLKDGDIVWLDSSREAIQV